MATGERPLSVAHLLAPAPFGGLETVVVTLAPAVAELGADVTVCLVVTPDDPNAADHPVARALEGSDVRVETWTLPAKAYREERRRVAELLERRSVDVLHTHGYRPDVMDASVARKRGVATASTVHGRIGGSWKGRMYEWVQARALRGFGAVFAVSDKLHRELRESGVPEDRLHLLPNAWSPHGEPLDRAEARARLGLPQDAPVVGWVGRMGREKAPDVLLEAAALVRDPDAVFSMIGDGPERESCEAMARESGIADRVVFHGATRDAGMLLGAYDVFALSSWTEGTPMALLEAISAGVPVVATSVGGVPNVVSPAEAHLREPGDVEGIAAGIDDVLDRPGPASRRARAAKDRLERDFAVEPWARRHLDVYRSLVNGR